MLDKCEQGKGAQTFAGHVASIFYCTWALEVMLEVGARSSLQLRPWADVERLKGH